MSIILIQYVLNCTDKNLGPIERLILCRLADFSDETGLKVFPSISRLCRNIGSSRSTTRRNLKNLIDKEYVSVVNRSNGSTKVTNQYKLNVEKIKKNSCRRNPNNLEKKMFKNLEGYTVNLEGYTVDLNQNIVDNFVDKAVISVDNHVDNRV